MGSGQASGLDRMYQVAKEPIGSGIDPPPVPHEGRFVNLAI
jgi:hypothetical protein